MRTLQGVEPLLDKSGKPIYFVGNASLCAVVMIDGVKSLMKCYTLTSSHLQHIYGDRYYPGELLVYTSEESFEWVDVVVDRWREGVTLTVELLDLIAAADYRRLKEISDSFNSLAHSLLEAEWAHGDLTPDNIIVESGAEVKMHLIDFDAQFIPSLEGQQSVELGTAAFQHPSRSVEIFDRHIDDFSIALIASALRALSYDVTLFDKYGDEDGLLLDAERVVANQSAAFDQIETLFLERGDTLFYRILSTLKFGTYHIPRLSQYINMASQQSVEQGVSACSLELFEQCGVWGYRTVDHAQVAIPAIYDEAYDFRDGVAVVRVAQYWQYISSSGDVICNCGAVERLRPAKNGVGSMLIDGEWHDVDLTNIAK